MNTLAQGRVFVSSSVCGSPVRRTRGRPPTACVVPTCGRAVVCRSARTAQVGAVGADTGIGIEPGRPGLRRTRRRRVVSGAVLGRLPARTRVATLSVAANTTAASGVLERRATWAGPSARRCGRPRRSLGNVEQITGRSSPTLVNGPAPPTDIASGKSHNGNLTCSFNFIWWAVLARAGTNGRVQAPG
jgi:hypothetical protein